MFSPYKKLFSTFLIMLSSKILVALVFPTSVLITPTSLLFTLRSVYLLGIVMFTRGTNVLIDSSGRVYITPHVVFNETEFPFSSDSQF